jgi:hypothetical protein
MGCETKMRGASSASRLCGLVALLFLFAPRPGASQDIMRAAATVEATHYQFTPQDAELLDAIERGCFNYLWNEVGAQTGFVRDHIGAEVANLGGVGFQLSAIAVAVERGWVSHQDGQERVLKILHALRDRDDNRRAGVHLHFVRAEDGDIHPPFRNEASTVDHALLMAGAMTAAEYFAGEASTIVNRMIDETNWSAFLHRDSGLLSMGWRPADNATMSGPGELITNPWYIASDEERIIYFLAAGAPRTEFSLPPAAYYRLKRDIKRHGNGAPFVASWNGIPFNYFFSHCWINYHSLGADDPRHFGVDGPRVDWFENSRRALLTHRQRCLEVAQEFASFDARRWGVSSCMGFDADGRRAYLVQQVRPNLVDKENWRQGTVAPYAAGGALPFTPRESIEALRAFRELQDESGSPLVWRGLDDCGYGLLESFNLDQLRATEDVLAIDAGPMMLAIENVRSGLVWRLFMEHPTAQRACTRLKLQSFDDHADEGN